MTSEETDLHNELMRKGQALVAVLLILAVVATVGLSIATRSVTEVAQSTAQEESARALEAAETALEQYLGGVSLTPGTVVNVDTAGTAQFSVGTTENIGLGGTSYEVPYLMEGGDVATLDLKTFSGTNIQLCWGKAGSFLNTNPPTMVLTVVYRNGSGEIMQQSRSFDSITGFDPVTSRRPTGFYSPATNTDCGTTTNYAFGRTIVFTNNNNYNMDLAGMQLMYARARMLYTYGTPQPMAFAVGGDTLPLQAGKVEATGVSGDSVQRIKAVVPNHDMPGIFDAAIFSGTSLTK